jgi:hypothetical protein
MSKCEGFVSLESKAVCCVCVFVRGGGVRQGGTGAATPVKDYSCIETSQKLGGKEAEIPVNAFSSKRKKEASLQEASQ